MRAFSFGRLAGLLLAAGTFAIASPSTALAAPPPNDNFADATAIPGLPFSDTVNNTEATTEPGEPQNCQFSPQTVWYTISPSADGVLRADLGGSSFFDTVLSVYRSSGPGLDGLQGINCASFGSSVDVKVHAGETYYVQAGSIFTGGGNLQFNLHIVPPPPNDDFADAKVITTIPFDDAVDATAATVQSGEPQASRCESPPPTATVWYAFTPSVGESVAASIGGFFSNLRVYTGSSLSSLTEVTCNNGGGATFRASANTTYYFQIFPVNPIGGGQLSFHLDVAPQPSAGFFFVPGDPSIFDDVQFIDQSFDPGQIGFQSEAWDLGEGATASGCCPVHRYTSDGDYSIRLIVTTLDGRTASTSQVVHVVTHDVAITNLDTPDLARAGRTKKITVSVNNTHYPENVQVDLYRSTPSGFVEVASLSQPVPVRGRRKSTDFVFSYAFTSDDAAIGKVSFKAIASIAGARDALPADNEATAPPTKVRP